MIDSVSSHFVLLFSQLTKAANKDVLLVERFGRAMAGRVNVRFPPLHLLAMMTHYASYKTFVEIIRHRFIDPKRTLQELQVKRLNQKR